MELSFSTTACPDLRLPQALQFAKKAGFERIELFRTWTESRPTHPDTSVKMVRAYLKDARFTLTGLNVRNLTGRKQQARPTNQTASVTPDLTDNLKQIEEDIDLARSLGLRSVNLKGGARTGEALADLIEGVNQLLERFSDVALNLGNHKGNRLQGLSDYQAMMPHLNERAKILLDTGHLLAVGEDIRKFAEIFADRIGLVHLRDQIGETPVPFGEGDLPFRDLFALLQAAGYDGTLVVELENVTWEPPLDATQKAREFVESLLAT